MPSNEDQAEMIKFDFSEYHDKQLENEIKNTLAMLLANFREKHS